MTPIWNDEIERIKQDTEASVFLVSFASQTEAKSAIHKLSFAKQITKDGRTGLALPGHVSFKVGNSKDGNLWILLAGRLSTEESLEAYELFGILGGEQRIVIPRRVQRRIIGVEAASTESDPVQQPTTVAPTLAASELKAVAEPVAAKPPEELTEIKFTPFVAVPTGKRIELAPIEAPVAVAKPQESNAVAPVTPVVKIKPAIAPAVGGATQTLAEGKPQPISTVPAEVLAKVAQLLRTDNVAPMPESVGIPAVEQPMIAKLVQEPTEIKFTPFVAAPSPKPIEVALPQSLIAVTKAPEPNDFVPAQTPAKVRPAATPVAVKTPQPTTEIKPVPVVIAPAQALPKVASLQEPGKVVSIQDPIKVSPVQKVIVPKPALEPATFKASPSPAGGSLAPGAVRTPSEPAKVVQSPAKIAPSPAVTAAHSQKDVELVPSLTATANGVQLGVRIYLAKEGTRQGPFTLEHINAEIVARRYRDDDFWAWHDGLPEWIPLYKVSGICKLAKA